VLECAHDRGPGERVEGAAPVRGRTSHGLHRGVDQRATRAGGDRYAVRDLRVAEVGDAIEKTGKVACRFSVHGGTVRPELAPSPAPVLFRWRSGLTLPNGSGWLAPTREHFN